jgi:hypothetical protein
MRNTVPPVPATEIAHDQGRRNVTASCVATHILQRMPSRASRMVFHAKTALGALFWGG